MTDSKRCVLNISLTSLLEEVKRYAGRYPHSDYPIRIIPSPQLSLLTAELDRAVVRYYTTENRETRTTREYYCGGLDLVIKEYEIDLTQIKITLS